MQRIERGHRLLEDHGDVVAAHLAQGRLVDGEQILSVKTDIARWMAGRGIGQKLQNRIGSHRFARTAFTHQRHHFARRNIEGDPLDSERLLTALMEGDGEITDGEESFGHDERLAVRDVRVSASGRRTFNGMIGTLPRNG